MHTQSVRTDAGNAVTLTLLGLAVAILAGVAVLYFMGKSMPQPEPYPTKIDEATTTDTAVETPDPRAGWNTYDNDEFDFSIMYPQGWIVATGTVLGVPIVTLYDATQQPASTSAFGVHELSVRVSLYPQGLPMGGKGEQKEQSTTILTVPEASALDYVLGSGKPWATVVNFARRPETWGESGFMYGRVAVQEEELAYMRGDTGVSPEEFDPYAGDTLVTYGFVDAVQWDLVSEILRSFSFATGEVSDSVTAPRITVATPQPGSAVSSPLTVSGEAHGSWYFEGSFPVRLLAADGTVLAEVPAPALEDWMQDAMVPFEVSLAFPATTATSGTLVLMRDNPSGLPENDASIKIPLTFGN
jgi:hypothetical protein